MGKQEEKVITLPRWKCKRCGHVWIPRSERKPEICPRCKTPYWDRERLKRDKDETT